MAPHTDGNAYLTERVPAFRSDRKADKATAGARRCRKAKGLYEETAGLPAFTCTGRYVMSSLFHPSLLFNSIGRSVDCCDSSFLSLKNKRLLVDRGITPIYSMRLSLSGRIA